MVPPPDGTSIGCVPSPIVTSLLCNFSCPSSTDLLLRWVFFREIFQSGSPHWSAQWSLQGRKSPPSLTPSPFDHRAIGPLEEPPFLPPPFDFSPTPPPWLNDCLQAPKPAHNSALSISAHLTSSSSTMLGIADPPQDLSHPPPPPTPPPPPPPPQPIGCLSLLSVLVLFVTLLHTLVIT